MSILSALRKSKSEHHDSHHTQPARQATVPVVGAVTLPVPQVARPSRRLSDASSITDSSTLNQEPVTKEQPKSGFLSKTKDAIMGRSRSPSPSGHKSSNGVSDAVRSFRSQLEEELRGTKEAALIAGISHEVFLGFIAEERLRLMPAKGSRWDKLLKWAEDFATKVAIFDHAYRDEIDGCTQGAELVYACLQALLLLGPKQGEALERAFSVCHEYGLIFQFYSRNTKVLDSIPEAIRQLGLALTDMVGFAVEVAVFYRKSARAMRTTSVTVDFNVTFGSRMASFSSRKDRIAELMWSWQLQKSAETSDVHVSIETLRQWLLPQDHSLQQRALVRAPGAVRAEFTCEWFDRPLIDFSRSRDKVLVISAEAGAGKSFLYGWILERLQRRVGLKEWSPVHASIDTQTRAQATQTALVKTLLLQLLEQNVGNVELFRALANVTELSANTASTQDADDALWYTLDTALKGLRNVMLVIDGLDAVDGGEEEVLDAFEHLHSIATKNPQVKVIILSRPLPKGWPKKVRSAAIDQAHSTIDVRHIIRSYLLSRGIATKPEAEKVAQELAVRSKGSLAWADLAVQLFGKATTLAEVDAAAKTLPSTLKEVINAQVSTIDVTSNARYFLSWLLVTERPLAVSEMQALLELNLTKANREPLSINIIDEIKKTCGSLVIIQDKTVRFRNETIRLHLLEMSKSKDQKLLLPAAEAHKDFGARLILYIKTSVARNTEPSMGEISSGEAETLYRSHSLLEYAARNWLGHFQRSSYMLDGKFQASFAGDLKSIFPTSTLLANLERRCWEKSALVTKANEMHLAALDIRRQVVGDSAPSVLQGCINVAMSFKKLSADADASKYFFQAAKVGQSILGRSNDLAIACATASLDCASKVTGKLTARDESVNQREEMLKFLLETEKERYGANSRLASKYSNQLAQMYSDIKENEKAEAIYRDVYKTSVAQNGEFSQEASAAAEKLQAVLYKEAKHEDVVQYTAPIFESAQRNLDIFDIRRVEITMRMAETYEKKKDVSHSEELYISLWRGLTEYCRKTAANSSASAAQINEAHERKIQISIAYARFLRRQGRDAEAQNILHGIWLDYQHRENKSSAIVKQLNVVGEELKSMGILDTAIAVFKSVWGYFKSSGEQTSTAAVGTAVALMGAVQEKAEKKAELKAAAKVEGKAGAAVAAEVDDDSDDEEDDEADKILEEVAEAAVTAPAAPAAPATAKGPTYAAVAAKVTIESSIQTCETLSQFYISKGRYTEAINVCIKLLKEIWPDMAVAGKWGFPKAHRAAVITFSRRLAWCYVKANQTEQAEKIYNAIFQSSLRSGFRVNEAIVTESSNQLIEFHKRTQQYSKALSVYQQLLESYRTSLGARNALTVQLFYTMGDLCTQYKLRGAETYYLEVFKAEKGSDGVLSESAMRAALALQKVYYEQKRWEQTREICASIWTTFTVKAKEYNMSTELVQSIYKRYTTVLETHLKVDLETLRTISVQYRDTCTKTYGANAQITASASLALADVCRKSTKAEHQAEAVKICEEVVAQADKAPADGKTKTKSAWELSLLASAKRSLAALYATQTAASTDKAAGAETNEKAVTLWKEQLDINKKQYGISGKATLASLSSLVGMWARSGKPELRTEAQQKLRGTVVEVLGESCSAGAQTDSTKLHASAVSLAKTYLSCNMSIEAWLLLRQLRFQIIGWGKISGEAAKDSSIKLPEGVDRRSLVFIAAFEETLRAQQEANKVVKTSFSDIMTDMLTEGILYDRYNLSVSTADITVEQKLFDGARLYAFLKTNDAEQHAEQLRVIEDALFKLFFDQYGGSIKSQMNVTRTFFAALLIELGQLRHHEDIVLVACWAITAKARMLLEAGDAAGAYDISKVLYQFLSSQKAFANPQVIPYAFKLSLYLAGLGVKGSNPEATLHTQMLELSTTVLRETLAACRTSNINLVSLQPTELDNLVRLMGEQRNYADLEWLLEQLWLSRVVQKSWDALTVVGVGRRLVQVYSVRGKHEQAVHLAESIVYNLRRTWGPLDSTTVAMANMLAELLASDSQYAEAMDVHGEVLQALLERNADNEESEDDSVIASSASLMAAALGKQRKQEKITDGRAAQIALEQLRNVQNVYARNGGWAEGEWETNGEELVRYVVDEFGPVAPAAFKTFPSEIGAWNKTAPPEVKPTAPASWGLQWSS
ncbi:hypothetical protein E8E14_005930 [Neopestalotiopsis sp. 37M]|nr:hypothetical protein E8E14_005930 [Neopestalotiopsis sp. 37M]